MIMWVLRRLAPETAHWLGLLALRTGLWRVQVIIDALITLAWTAPLVLVLRLARAASAGK
jgi:hypothetical protein